MDPLLGSCKELHIGDIPRSIMTKGNSVTNGTQYRNFIRGNKDKLMITYRREPSHDYSMRYACGVLFEGEIHFFGGVNNTPPGFGDFSRQHFVIETKRRGQLVKMTAKEDLEIGFVDASCSSFTFFETTIVTLCFDSLHQKSCYSFDGKLTHICDSNLKHYPGGLVRYKSNLLTVGSVFQENQKTEIMTVNENKNFAWSVVEPNFKFTEGETIDGHSLVTVESSDINEEYVLLIGGIGEIIGGYGRKKVLQNVFKFNGTWFPFGKLNKPRYDHNSIYWNGAVYVIGGNYHITCAYEVTCDLEDKTKMEIWNIKDSPNQFKTTENWPELFYWMNPHLFIVPDSFFPDY